jgi:hypothetical protein
MNIVTRPRTAKNIPNVLIHSKLAQLAIEHVVTPPTNVQEGVDGQLGAKELQKIAINNPTRNTAKPTRKTFEFFFILPIGSLLHPHRLQTFDLLPSEAPPFYIL